MRIKFLNLLCQNYDAKVYAKFITQHNSNLKTTKEVYISMPANVVEAMQQYISNRIAEIKQKLKEL